MHFSQISCAWSHAVFHRIHRDIISFGCLFREKRESPGFSAVCYLLTFGDKGQGSSSAYRREYKLHLEVETGGTYEEFKNSQDACCVSRKRGSGKTPFVDHVEPVFTLISCFCRRSECVGVNKLSNGLIMDE